MTSKFAGREIIWVSIKDLYVPTGAQREYKPSWAADIAERFDPEMMDPLSVSQRTNGGAPTWWLNDGQHRRDAALKWGLGPDDMLPCWPSSKKLSQEEMAEKFLQGQDRKRIGHFERFTIGVAAGRVAENEVQGLIDRAGLKVSRNHDPGCIAAASALMWVYHGPGRNALWKTLCAWRDAFQGEPTASTAILLKGLGMVFGRYHELTVESAVAALSKVPPSVTMEHARRNVARYGRSLPESMAAGLVDLLNRGLPRGEKLPPWWRVSE